MSRKNYLNEWRETNKAMSQFLNSDITNEADMLNEEEINILPSADGSDDNNIAGRSQNDVVEENSLNSETENRDTELKDTETNSELLEDIGSIAEYTSAEELASWAINNKITRVALSQLVAVLKRYNLRILPKKTQEVC